MVLSQSTIFQRASRAAAALNNIGVALLQKQPGSPQEALLTLQDSLQLWRFALDAIDTSGTPNTNKEAPCTAYSNEVLAVIDSSVQRAVLRMARNTPKIQNSSSILAQETNNVNGITVHVISTGDYDKPTAYLHQQPPGTIYAVRFDDADCGCTVGGLNDDDPATASTLLDVHVAVVLLNQTLARYCMSLATANAESHSSATLQLAAMSQGILERLSVQCTSEGGFFLKRRLLCLYYTNTQNLLVILREFRQFDHLFISEAQIRDLQEQLEYLQGELDSFSPWCTASRAVVAAAA